MRKGLTATLMTVAVALLAVQAMAMAPVIGDVPSPIVGNADQVTGVTGFIFQDALNLGNYVVDDSTPAAQIQWTYSIVGSANYVLNGVPALAAGEDPGIPPSGKVVNTQVLNSEANLDSNPATVTVRNINLTPFSGTGATPGTGIVDVQAVTLWASDGSTAGQKTIFFYSDAGGNDRLSPGGGGELQWDDNMSNGPTRSSYTFQPLAGITASDASGTAICLNAPPVGNNMAWYQTANGKISLVQNSVYRLRATMSGSNASVGSTPFWDFVIDNFSADASKGFNAYGADYMFFDNLGGAESVIQTPKTFEIYFCPPAISTARWNDTSVATNTAGASLFSAANTGNKDARVIFRVMDVNSNPGIGADTKSGSICLTELKCDRFDISALPVVTDANNYTPSGLSASAQATALNIGCTTAFSGGAMIMTPTAVTCLTQLAPGGTDFSSDAGRITNFPIPWADQTLYKVTVSMNAASSTPPGVYWVGSDSASTEIIGQSFSTNQCWGAGMPQVGASQDFVFFAFSQFVGTGGGNSSFVRLRPWLMLGGNPDFAGSVGASGVVNVTGMKMEKVQRPN